MTIEEKISAKNKKIEEINQKIKKEEEKIADFKEKIKQLKVEIEQITNEEIKNSLSQIEAEPLEFIALIKEMQKQKLNPVDTLDLLKEMGGSTGDGKQENTTEGYGE